MKLIDRLLGREQREPGDIAERERELAEAQRIHDDQVTDRSYVRFGPRQALPQEHDRD